MNTIQTGDVRPLAPLLEKCDAHTAPNGVVRASSAGSTGSGSRAEPALPYFLLGLIAFVLLGLVCSMGAMLGVRVELRRQGIDRPGSLMAAPYCDRRVEVCP